MSAATEPRLHPVTRVFLTLWLVGAFKFAYLAVLLWLRLSGESPPDDGSG